MYRDAPLDRLRSLRISNKQHAYIRNAARAAAKDDYKEICGIFFVRSGYLRFIRKQNRTAQSGVYVLANRDLREAAAKTSGIFGAFHSHPVGEANPSNGDVAAGPRDGHAVIYDVIGDEFRLWRVARYDWSLQKSFDFDRSWLTDTSDD